jgi:AcrR family transcriptional regulator
MSASFAFSTIWLGIIMVFRNVNHPVEIYRPHAAYLRSGIIKMTSRVASKQTGHPNSALNLRGSKLPKSAEKRREVIRAAYHTLAERGFEGLRMREIAKRAGLDHSTLHYYFKGKEALIHGVLDYIVQELSIGRGPATEAEDMTPRRRLDTHFDALRWQMRDRPEMFVVLAEINARSMRDPAIRSFVIENDRGWKRFLVGILREGIQKREFHARLSPEVAAKTIISLVRGLSVTCAGRAEDMRRPLRQLSKWLEA